MPAKTKTADPLAKISHTHRPQNMSLEDWQRALRLKVSRLQPLKLVNLGKEPVFSEFAVTNPTSKRTYRVAIRGETPGVNFCSCPDYAVNTLGTCKHVEFVLNHLRRKYATTLRRGWKPPFSEVFIRYGAQRSVLFSPTDDCPTGLRRQAQQCFGDDGTLHCDAVDRFDDFTAAATRSGHELRVYDDALEYVAELRDARARQALLTRRYDGGRITKAWNNLLNVDLYPYQREGAIFAAQAGRAILADEMGLGKTIQAIAAAEILARDAGVERVLIVCPASLKYQWKSEIERFCKRTALILEGLTHTREALYAEPSFFKIVNYDVIHRDLDAVTRWQPDLVILDEAQRIKNWQTRTAKSVKRLASRFALVLTGTPLENRIDELHSIVEFVDRFRLGPLFAFKARHEEHDPDSSRVVGYRELGRITKTLAPILLRRTVKEVAKQLPPRLEKNFFVPMTEQQWVPHDENREIVARIVHKWRKYKFLTEADQLRLRIALQNMRMVCDSTYLIDRQTRHGTKIDELRRLLSEIFEDHGAKVVIFSQWVRMNELVEEMLDDAGWGHVHLHGGVPSRKRGELTRALREEPDCRVFLSTDAGGVGLNLQTASSVINLDLPWNPAVLNQRIGRVHRLGQQRPVRVVNFISEHTIEHGMLSLLAFKKSIFAGVLDGATDRVFMGEGAMSRFMKTVESAAAAIPTAPDGARDTVTPELESAPTGMGTDAAIDPDDEEQVLVARSPAEISVDTRALGLLLDQGAAMLRQVGQSLLGAGGRSPTAPPLPFSLTTDGTTGRRELRLPLPDEKVLQQWVGQLSSFFSGFRPRE